MMMLPRAQNPFSANRSLKICENTSLFPCGRTLATGEAETARGKAEEFYADWEWSWVPKT